MFGPNDCPILPVGLARRCAEDAARMLWRHGHCDVGESWRPNRTTGGRCAPHHPEMYRGLDALDRDTRLAHAIGDTLARLMIERHERGGFFARLEKRPAEEGG